MEFHVTLGAALKQIANLGSQLTPTIGGVVQLTIATLNGIKMLAQRIAKLF
jgi:hypothetical protein